ncbi:Hypothetical protein CINCED_3A011666, partial [Cinara cedri]
CIDNLTNNILTNSSLPNFAFSEMISFTSVLYPHAFRWNRVYPEQCTLNVLDPKMLLLKLLIYCHLFRDTDKTADRLTKHLLLDIDIDNMEFRMMRYRYFKNKIALY